MSKRRRTPKPKMPIETALEEIPGTLRKARRRANSAQVDARADVQHMRRFGLRRVGQLAGVFRAADVPVVMAPTRTRLVARRLAPPEYQEQCAATLRRRADRGRGGWRWARNREPLCYDEQLVHVPACELWAKPEEVAAAQATATMHMSARARAVVMLRLLREPGFREAVEAVRRLTDRAGLERFMRAAAREKKEKLA